MAEPLDHEGKTNALGPLEEVLRERYPALFAAGATVGYAPLIDGWAIVLRVGPGHYYRIDAEAQILGEECGVTSYDVMATPFLLPAMDAAVPQLVAAIRDALKTVLTPRRSRLP